MEKTIMSNLTINSHSMAHPNHDYSSFNEAVGAGQINPLDRSLDIMEEEEISAFEKGGLLGENAEKYIMDSANISSLPGDDEDDDEDDDDEIDLDEELEIETDEVDAESIEIDDEDPDDIIEEDDDDLDDDDDIL